MANSYFRFRQFTINQDRCAMKVTTDGCLFGAWTVRELQEHVKERPVTDLLDIGTGTGLLSLMIAQELVTSIMAVEIDDAAAEQAKENVTAAPWQDRIRVVQGDIRGWDPGKKFDVIVSNPPFYENELASPGRGRNMAHHAGGLLLRELIDEVKRLLAAEGVFCVLLPAKRAVEVEQRFGDAGLNVYKKAVVHASPSHSPSRVMYVLGFEPREAEEKTIFIRGEDGGYSEEFRGLLGGYYLSERLPA